MARSVIIVPAGGDDDFFPQCREVYIDNFSDGLQVGHGSSYRDYSYKNNLGIDCGTDFGYIWGINFARMGFFSFQETDNLVLVYVPYFVSKFQKDWFRNSGIKNHLENKQLGIISLVVKDGYFAEESRSVSRNDNYEYLCNRILGTNYTRVKK